MNHPADEPLRIGVVPYLNVQPLIWSLSQSSTAQSSHAAVQIESAPPRILAERLSRGAYHVAIVPIMEYLLRPNYAIIPGVAIGAAGPVRSVALFSSVPLDHIAKVYLDPASLTSVNLVQVLLAEKNLQPHYVGEAQVSTSVPLEPGEARVLIGDPALREEHNYRYVFDLGTMWHELTGLPFVFAAWLVHSSARNRHLNAIFQQARDLGLERLEEVAVQSAAQFDFEPQYALDYFRNNISYELGAAQAAGIRRFAELCLKHGQIGTVPELIFQEN